MRTGNSTRSSAGRWSLIINVTEFARRAEISLLRACAIVEECRIPQRRIGRKGRRGNLTPRIITAKWAMGCKMPQTARSSGPMTITWLGNYDSTDFSCKGIVMQRIALIVLIALGAATARAQETKDVSGKETQATGAQEQWTPLFNGQDVAGWSDVLDNNSSWQIIDGMILGQGGGRGQPGVLVADRQNYVNFKLRVQFNYRDPGSGGCIEVRRSSPGENMSSSYRVAAHLHPNRMKVRAPGTVLQCTDYRYGTAEPQPRSTGTPIPAAAGHWHTLEIHVVGNTITTWLNGRKADEFTDSKAWFPSGGIALVCRGDSAVLYREVSIIELPE